MPRLPTMRVIGSQDISTILPDFGRLSVAGRVAVSIENLHLDQKGSCSCWNAKNVRRHNWGRRKTGQFRNCRNERVDSRSLIQAAGVATWALYSPFDA